MATGQAGFGRINSVDQIDMSRKRVDEMRFFRHVRSEWWLCTKSEVAGKRSFADVVYRPPRRAIEADLTLRIGKIGSARCGRPQALKAKSPDFKGLWPERRVACGWLGPSAEWE